MRISIELMQYTNVASELAALDAKIDAFLPSRYEHCYTSVPASSMGSAGLNEELTMMNRTVFFRTWTIGLVLIVWCGWALREARAQSVVVY